MKYHKVLIAGVAISLLTGCGANPVSEKVTIEEKVGSLAKERIDALMRGDYESAISYTSDAYQSVVSPAQYAQKYSGSRSWVSAELVQVKCEVAENFCMVGFNLSYKFPRMGDVQSVKSTQRWLRVAERWSIYHKLN